MRTEILFQPRLRVCSPRARRYDVDPGPDPSARPGRGLTVGRRPEPPAETPRVLLLAAIGEGLAIAYEMREHGEHVRADRLEQRVSQLQALLPHYLWEVPMAVVEHEPLTVPQVEAPAPVREVLHRAADLLEEFGWCQGLYEMNGASGMTFCVVGAVARARADLGNDRKGYDSDGLSLWGRTEEWMDELGMDDRIHVWNDTPGRTKAEVVARLRHAAETAA